MCRLKLCVSQPPKSQNIFWGLIAILLGSPKELLALANKYAPKLAPSAVNGRQDIEYYTCTLSCLDTVSSMVTLYIF